MLIILSCRQEKKSQGEEKSKWSKGHSVNFNQELLIREQMQIKLFLDHQQSLKMNLTNSGLRYMIYKNGVGRDKAKAILPSHLAHGLLGDRENIPPQSILYLDVELIDLKK